MRFYFVIKWSIMRTLMFVISILVLSVLVLPESAYSQNNGTALPEFESPEEVSAEVTDDDPYDLATDEQIEEAQRFYESCKNNETFSARKNCKCAAAAFLETRILLGDTATVDEIMEENINSCLLDEDKGNIPYIDDLDLEEVTKKQMEEAEFVFQSCKESPRVSRFVDCECLAAKFLDLRIKRGPLPPQSLIVSEITQKECRNIVETTGMEFERCMRGTGFKYYNIRPKDYCECYAKAWGKIFKGFNGLLDERKKANMRLRARSICRKPESYRGE
ncbi:MAG: hypothetical protein KAJ29_08110 [Alphaproteobacteria bacterium]|nr:hypothetical protein [Alphaproteobacteria bacterium]